MVNLYSILTKLVIQTFKKIRKKIELSKYDDFSIAEYLRKQGAQVGVNNRIMIRDLGLEAGLIKIGNHCTISSRVILLVHDGSGWLFTNEIPDIQKFGFIEILDNCFIGMGAIILPNVRIGPNSIVGAGAVVTKNVPANTVVAGNPARKICGVIEYKDKLNKAWANQRPDNYLSDLKNGNQYDPKYIEKRKSLELNFLVNHLKTIFWPQEDDNENFKDKL